MSEESRQSINSGRLYSDNDAERDVCVPLQTRERIRMEILVAVDQAEASLASDAGRVVTAESMKQLAQEVKERGRARLALRDS